MTRSSFISVSILFSLLLTTINLTQGFNANPPFSAEKIADLQSPRSVQVDPVGDILVVEAAGNTGISAVFESAGGGGTFEKVLIVDGTGLNLNHGLLYVNGSLYASSETIVYHWPYTPGQRTLILQPGTPVIRNIPFGGVHTGRSLAIDPTGSKLFVTVGSAQNVDDDSSRARIRYFDDSLGLPGDGFLYENGILFADGLRNAAGIDFDKNGVLFGLDNGAEDATRPEFGDIHLGNPAEELNKFDGPLGQHHGYPYCFSSFELEGFEAGTQFAWSTFLTDGIHSDEWCRNLVNNKPPALALPMHENPVGLKFFKGLGCDSVTGSFPCSSEGDAFVTFHGSSSSAPPQGFRVASVTFDQQTSLPTGDLVEILTDVSAVGVDFSRDGHLIVSDDLNNQLIRVTYSNEGR